MSEAIQNLKAEIQRDLTGIVPPGRLVPQDVAKNLQDTLDLVEGIDDRVIILEENSGGGGGGGESPTPNDTVRVDGGEVSWLQNYEFRVSPTNYRILGETLSAPETDVELSASDPDNNRIDVIAVNTDNQVVVIEGTPSANPEKPYVDPNTQLELTFVTVFADTVEPPDVENITVYNENLGTGGGEWNGTSSSGTIILGDTTSPRQGTKDINCTAGAVGAMVTFDAGSNQTVNPSQKLVMGIKSKASWGNGNNAKRLIFSLLNASNQVVGNTVLLLTSGTYGFDSSGTSYVQVAIPFSDFGILAGDVIRKVRFQVAGNSGTIGFYMDPISINFAQDTPATSDGATGVTYAQLRTLQAASGLVPGAQYRVTDFRTKHYIVDGSGVQYVTGADIITGELEPLIVTAITKSTLSPVAKSTIYPADIIHVDFDPNKWLADLSFADNSGTPTIIPNWRGTITRRIDTNRNIDMGYDWKNCRFRRWRLTMTGDYEWNNIDEYARGALRYVGNNIYVSMVNNNIGNDPTTEDTLWGWIGSRESTMYVCYAPNQSSPFVGSMPIDPDDFVDVLTFENSVGYESGMEVSETYETLVANVISGAMKDDYNNWNGTPTILQNNVFYLTSEGFYNYVNLTFKSAFNCTFVCDYCSENDFGHYTNQGLFYGAMSGNTIGNYFQQNIAHSLSDNEIGNQVTGTYFSYQFKSNVLKGGCSQTMFLNHVRNNSFLGLVDGSSFSRDVLNCHFKEVSGSTIWSANQYCNFFGFLNAAKIMTSNTYGTFGNLNGTTIGPSTNRLHVPGGLPALIIDFATVPRAFGQYDKTIGVAGPGAYYIRYIDSDFTEFIGAYDTP